MPLFTPPVIACWKASRVRLLPIFWNAACSVLFRPHSDHWMSSPPPPLPLKFGSTWFAVFRPGQGDMNAEPLAASPELWQTAVATVFRPIVMPTPRHLVERIWGLD